MKDAKGRPIIVVTGTGIVTALGEGKQDNWAALTSGRSGIHTITRFPTEGLRTTIGGTIDFIEADPFNCSELTTGNRQARGIRGGRAVGAGTRADFPGPLFLAMPPIEMEWPLREKLLALSGKKDAASYDDLIAASRPLNGTDRIDCLFGSVGERLAETFGTKGLADLADHRLRLRRDRDPARHRGDPPRRERSRARGCRRRFDEPRNDDPFLAAFSAFHPE